MAEIRKKDRLLAEEKKIAREREAEGEMYADKEVFMTEAYKKQKAELERIEAEEKKREGKRECVGYNWRFWLEQNEDTDSFFRYRGSKQEEKDGIILQTTFGS